METPFYYPKVRHFRNLKPDDGRPYPKYKPFLQIEFSARCVYCEMPDSLREPDSFGVDHYKPKSLFPEAERAYGNLFYACNPCNRRKGAFWPTREMMERGLFVPNPCDHVMFHHVRFDGARVSAKTQAGKWTVELLDLNDPNVVEYRQNVLGLIKMAKEKLAKLIQEESDLRRQNSDDEAVLNDELELLRINRIAVSKHLCFLTGKVQHA